MSFIAYLSQYAIYIGEIGLTYDLMPTEIHSSHVGTVETHLFCCGVDKKINTVVYTEFALRLVVTIFGPDSQHEHEKAGTRPGTVLSIVGVFWSVTASVENPDRLCGLP